MQKTSVAKLIRLVCTLQGKGLRQQAITLARIILAQSPSYIENDDIAVGDLVIPNPHNWEFEGKGADTTMLLGKVEEIREYEEWDEIGLCEQGEWDKRNIFGDETQYVVRWRVGSNEEFVGVHSADELHKVSKEWVQHYEEALRAMEPIQPSQATPAPPSPKSTKPRRRWVKKHYWGK